MEDTNRLKVVLVEKKRTYKWLAELLGVNPTTILRVYEFFSASASYRELQPLKSRYYRTVCEGIQILSHLSRIQVIV